MLILTNHSGTSFEIGVEGLSSAHFGSIRFPPTALLGFSGNGHDPRPAPFANVKDFEDLHSFVQIWADVAVLKSTDALACDTDLLGEAFGRPAMLLPQSDDFRREPSATNVRADHPPTSRYSVTGLTVLLGQPVRVGIIHPRRK